MPIVDIKLNKETFTRKYSNHSLQRIHFNLSQEMAISPSLLALKREKIKKNRLLTYTAKLEMPNKLILSDYEMFIPNNGPHSIFYDERCIHYHIKPHLNEKDVHINTFIEAILIVLPWKYKTPLSELQLELFRHKDGALIIGRNECGITSTSCLFTTVNGDGKFHTEDVKCVHLKFTPMRFLEYDTKYIARVTVRGLKNQHAAIWSFTTRSPPGILLNREFLWMGQNTHH